MICCIMWIIIIITSLCNIQPISLPSEKWVDREDFDETTDGEICFHTKQLEKRSITEWVYFLYF